MPRRRAANVSRASSDGLPIAELQLATLVDAAPDGDEWLHERKYDGYRILADRAGADVHLYSRRFNDWTAPLAAVAGAVAALPVRRVVLDGEVCVVTADGKTSFQALQNAFGGGGPPLTYFVFDVLAIDDEVLVGLPLEARKQRLAALLARAPAAAARVLAYSDHVIGGGPAFFHAACEIGLEGIVSKRRDRPYAPGRGPGWVKTKCILRQELVIGGFTDPEGSRSGLGALLVGYHDAGALVYAGKVGTGFNAKTLDELRATLDPLVIAACPFTPPPQRAWTGPRAHWVKPALVAEIAFSEWTTDGRLRHPSFKGLRRDKSPTEIGRERAVVQVVDAAPSGSRASARSRPGPRSGRTRPLPSKRRRRRRRREQRGARRASGGHRPRARARAPEPAPAAMRSPGRPHRIPSEVR